MPPVNILIKPASSLCNMRCKYCFYRDVSQCRDTDSFGIMKRDTLDELVRSVFEYAEGSAVFSFQGGEPTLAGLDFYKELISLEKKYNKKGIQVSNSLQTNGYIIDKEWAKFFAENNFLIGLSLDGDAEIHNENRIDANGKGTYNRVTRAAELFRAHGVQFNILCVVNNMVARYPRRVYNALKKYGFIQFIACLDPFDGETSDFSLSAERYRSFLTETFREYYKDFLSGRYVSVRNFDNYLSILMRRPPESCAMQGFCTCYLVAEGDGSIYPCDFYVLDEWRLGVLGEASLSEMLLSERAKEFVNISRNRPSECYFCKYFSLCRGGCRRECEPIPTPCTSLPKNRFCEAYKGFFDECYGEMLDMAERIASGRYSQ